MNTIRISYSIEGLKAIDSNAPETIQSTIEYTLPERESMESAGAGLQKAFAAFISHPAVGEFVTAMEKTSVAVSTTGVERQEIPVGAKLRQMYRLAQAKLGV